MVEGDDNVEKEVHVTTEQVQVEMQMTNWAMAQKEDPVLNVVLSWLGTQKKTDLRTLLGEHTPSKEGWMVWRNCQNFMTLQNALYLWSMPKGRMRICYSSCSERHIELLLWMGVIEIQDTKAVTVLCPYYKNVFSGQEWPNRWDKLLGPVHTAFTMRVAFPKALLCPILATAPLDLLHVDFTSIETTLEPNQSPRVTNVLMFQDHFTKHVLAYVTPDQTAKTITKFLYKGYVSIFGALARLLSDRGASFMSSVIEEMCKILGVKQLQTTPYHPQTNGQVERLHQMIMHMIRKLGQDKKADWPSHLAEIAHAYNATQSTVTGYSPHYLMFRQ